MNEQPAEIPPAKPPETPASLRRIVFFSVTTGLCPLIPFPFVDDWVRDLMRRRLAGDLAVQQGLAVASPPLKILACGESKFSASKMLRGCLLTAIIKPVFVVLKKLALKLFRKILFFLTLKDCVTTATQTFHEGYLLRHALQQGELTGEPDLPQARRIRGAMERVLEGRSLGPVEEIFRIVLRGSWGSVKGAARHLGREARRLRRSGRDDAEALRDLDLEDEEARLSGVVDEITRALGEEKGYLGHLERLLAEQLAADLTSEAPGG